MPHDEHSLTRLDRVSDSYEELELALGLYRDHELVRFVLDHVKLPDAAERVAFALTADRGGPHVIVARDGGFVTCLEALATKHERIRTGLALARKRGMDSSGRPTSFISSHIPDEHGFTALTQRSVWRSRAVARGVPLGATRSCGFQAARLRCTMDA